MISIESTIKEDSRLWLGQQDEQDQFTKGSTGAPHVMMGGCCGKAASCSDPREPLIRWV